MKMADALRSRAATRTTPGWRWRRQRWPGDGSSTRTVSSSAKERVRPCLWCRLPTVRTWHPQRLRPQSLQMQHCPAEGIRSRGRGSQSGCGFRRAAPFLWGHATTPSMTSASPCRPGITGCRTILPRSTT